MALSFLLFSFGLPFASPRYRKFLLLLVCIILHVLFLPRVTFPSSTPRVPPFAFSSTPFSSCASLTFLPASLTLARPLLSPSFSHAFTVRFIPFSSSFLPSFLPLRNRSPPFSPSSPALTLSTAFSSSLARSSFLSPLAAAPSFALPRDGRKNGVAPPLYQSRAGQNSWDVSVCYDGIFFFFFSSPTPPPGWNIADRPFRWVHARTPRARGRERWKGVRIEG